MLLIQLTTKSLHDANLSLFVPFPLQFLEAFCVAFFTWNFKKAILILNEDLLFTDLLVVVSQPLKVRMMFEIELQNIIVVGPYLSFKIWVSMHQKQKKLEY